MSETSAPAPRNPAPSKNALVLSGGGARAAYQAGFLRGMAELIDNPTPFRIFSGTSAGAINCAHLAAHLHLGFGPATEQLWNLWAGLTLDRIFKTGTFSLSRLALQWIAKLTLGGAGGTGKVNYLLDTSPLRDLLADHVDFEAIQANLRSGALQGLAFNATNYQTGTAVCFFNSHDGKTAEWYRSDRMGVRTRHRLEHVLASSAIPVFFPPEWLDGYFFGDGCIRQTTPLSPPIHLGAERLMAIGIRAQRTPERTQEMNLPRDQKKVQLSEIAGTLLNAVFLDSVEKDAERLERINRTLSLIPADQQAASGSDLRPVPFRLYRPSTDLGTLAREIPLSFPPTLRHLMRGLGTNGKEASSDLVSYLAFDTRYTLPLLELGRTDAHARAEDIRSFFAN